MAYFAFKLAVISPRRIRLILSIGVNMFSTTVEGELCKCIDKDTGITQHGLDHGHDVRFLTIVVVILAQSAVAARELRSATARDLKGALAEGIEVASMRNLADAKSSIAIC